MTKPPLHGSRLPRSRRSATGILKGALSLLLLALLLGGLSCGPVGNAAAANSEYQVKVAFLYNFMKFVEWPGEGSAKPGVLTLGIIGSNPFAGALEEVRDKTAKGRRVVVLHSLEEVKECDLLFVCSSEKGRLSQILKAAQNYHILTVSDQDGFCQAGGMINLVFVKSRVGFEVNLPATTRAKLKVSSQLLRLARLVLE
jgi:hypothetical protein